MYTRQFSTPTLLKIFSESKLQLADPNAVLVTRTPIIYKVQMSTTSRNIRTDWYRDTTRNTRWLVASIQILIRQLKIAGIRTLITDVKDILQAAPNIPAQVISPELPDRPYWNQATEVQTRTQQLIQKISLSKILLEQSVTMKHKNRHSRMGEIK